VPRSSWIPQAAFFTDPPPGALRASNRLWEHNGISRPLEAVQGGRYRIDSSLQTCHSGATQNPLPTMTKVALNTVAMLVVTTIGCTPVSCWAHALDDQLACQLSAHAFIKPLLDSRDVNPMPIRVEANSVNAFRPTHDSHLTAFGYRVDAVLGYEQGDAMFKQGSGKPIANSGYGVVVFGPSDTVRAKVREAGSDAVVREVIPLLLTVIFCSGP
jgi:hypothetical protein